MAFATSTVGKRNFYWLVGKKRIWGSRKRNTLYIVREPKLPNNTVFIEEYYSKGVFIV
jgi:hypothetical protein